MAAAWSSPTNREAWNLPAASPGDVPSGAGEPGQGRTPGQVDEAEPNGSCVAASRGTWPQREGGLCPPVAQDDFMAALRWSRPSQQLGASHLAWPDRIEQPGPRGKACSPPLRSAGKAAKDGDSSVSPGRLSGSSGGHEPCTPGHWPWKERPPQVLGPPRQLRKSNVWLEQLKDKIRAQAQWQASCASLGTSIPSSANISKACTPAPGRMARRLENPPPAQAYPGLGILSAAEGRVEDTTIPGQGREPRRVSRHRASVSQKNTRRMENSSYKRQKAPKLLAPRKAARDKGLSKEVGAAESAPVHPWIPSPASDCSDPQVSASMPSLTSRSQPAATQTAMATLQGLRQQIQTGLELAQAQHPRGGQALWPSKRALQGLAGRRLQGPSSAPDLRGSSWKSPRAVAEGRCPFSEGTGSLPTRQRWSTLAEWGSSPQRAWAAQGRHPSFQRPGSPPERFGASLQRPWSASAGQPSSRQRTWAACKDWEASKRGLRSPLERPGPPAQRSWSASFTQRAHTPHRSKGSLLPPSGAKHAWPKLGLKAPQNAPGKENQAQPPLPGLKPRGLLGHPYSSKSLREFMHRKRMAHRQQALEEKASAEQALELRTRRLQAVYKKQREAVLGRAAPVVSQTRPGIVTFVPHSAQSRGLEAPGSLGPPVLEWSKVTSGMVLGDQEAPGSFCVCLSRALNRPGTLERGGSQDGQDGAPLLMSASSSLGPLKLQDLATRCLCPGLCIYFDPEEAEHLGTPGPLHFRYKQARLQALEATANILKQRINVLTAKLQRPEDLDSLRDLASGSPASSPSTVPATPTLADPACPGDLVPSGGREPPQDWASKQAMPLLCPAFSEGETTLWSPGWERSRSPRGHDSSKPRGFMEDGRLELDKRLARSMASLQGLGPFSGSTRGVPAMPFATCSSLQREEMPPARGAGLVMPRSTRSSGRWEPGGPRSPHLASLQQKSLSFLRSLKLDQQKQEQALALLRQRAQMEVWETQKALEELLFKHRLERPMEKYSTHPKLETALEREQPPLCGDLEPKTIQSPVTGRPGSHPAPGRDATSTSQDPQEGQESQADKSASAGPTQEGRPEQCPSQLPQARPHPCDNPIHQWSLEGLGSANLRALGDLALQMLQQNLREEELRGQHRAALLRLREVVLEESRRAERAWRAHRRGCPGSKGNPAALAALMEKQQPALSSLEQRQREIRDLWDVHPFSHQERALLLRQQKDILSMQRSMARLQQDLWAWTRRLQNLDPDIKPTQAEGSETSQQPEGPAQGSSCPLTAHRPGSPTSHHRCRSPGSPQVLHLLTEQRERPPSQAASAADSHPQPPGLAWGEDTAWARSWPDAQGQPAERHSRSGQGDPLTNPRPSSAETIQSGTDKLARSFQGRHDPRGGGRCGPGEAGVVKVGMSQDESELGLDVASSPMEEPHNMESQRSGEQRIETCWQEDPRDAISWQEAALLPASPVRAPAEEVSPPAQCKDTCLPQCTAPLDLASESEPAPGTCSGPWARSPASSVGSTSSLSCLSLPEFQKASAVLVQLSGSSVSLSDWEAGETPDTDLGWSGELSAPDSWGVPRGRGQVTWETLEGGGAHPPCGSPTVARGPAPAPGGLWAGKSLPLPGATAERSGSELSVASSEVWDEEGLLEPGANALPAGGSSRLESGRTLGAVLPSSGPGKGQEASGTSGSLTSGSNLGKAKWRSPEAAHMAFPAKAASSDGLDLSPSLPLGSSAAKGTDLGRGGEIRPPQTSAGCPEGPWDADLRPPTGRKPLWASPEPGVPVSPKAPPGDLGGLAPLTSESRAPGGGGSGAAPVPEEAWPEIPSPVDEVPSHVSANLPPSTHRVSHLPPPPPPPPLPAESEAGTASPHSEDFPSPPEGAMWPGGLLSAPEEDASINISRLPSLSKDNVPEALSPGTQKLGLCLGTGGQGGSLGDKLGESSSVGGAQAMGGQWSDWPGPPLCVRAGHAPRRLAAQSPTLSRMVMLVAGDTGLCGPWPGNPPPALGTDLGTHPPGMEGASVVDLVSTQLTRRILCDSLAALSELAGLGSPLVEGLAGASMSPRLTQQPQGSHVEDWTSEKTVEGPQ
ncbi:coiled-coil domain-containing protein 187 isoform X2 [Manis javanica]|uniref:coiled-coil domain-containing protein 187 isoform X2 n=1 Tax=Manis javanica TaxID=9974 RepID=UPI003C6CE3D2